MALGSGIGFASVSPWPGHGASATTFTLLTAAWLVVVQWGSAVIGGYTTGRLRTKWTGLHTHEVFFRDTAHGLVTWATATVITALLVSGAAFHAAGQGMQAAAVASSAAMGHVAHHPPLGGGDDGNVAMGHRQPFGEDGNATSYELDKLFRSTSAEPVAPERYEEVMRIMHSAVGTGALSDEDRAYLSKLVAARAGIPAEEAQKRVDDMYAQMKAAEARVRLGADAARKAAAQASVFMALSMLVGAFVACIAAALGGKRRDEHL
jgi:hypothetical protein